MKKKFIIPVLFIIFTALGVGIWSTTSIEPITSCDPIGDARPLCDWQNPEDMVALSDGRHVIVSEFGDQNGARPGTLALLDLETETRHLLYNGGSDAQSGPWGEDNCQEPADGEFSPHGIHVSQRAEGQLQLLAVQHAGRESVEMFEVIPSDDRWTLAWRGCVIAPQGSMINDVVGTPDGGFLVTHMMPNEGGTAAMFAEYLKSSMLGVKSGYVLAWRPDEGFSQLVSSEGTVPNGIEIAADGVTVFVNYSAGGEVRRINRLTDEIEASNSNLPPLDNASWTPDGRLLVAGSTGSMLEGMACTNLEVGSCPAPFAIIAVDPETLESDVIYEGGPGTPGGGGTVGLMVSDGSLLIGTFAGDRIVRVEP
ncbi:MAG: hypothetical protein QNJ45_08500 [Ardenticatenaceae bacterium]|nr:hypothetical protein [Ardenticatenaceae bacterium]